MIIIIIIIILVVVIVIAYYYWEEDEEENKRDGQKIFFSVITNDLSPSFFSCMITFSFS